MANGLEHIADILKRLNEELKLDNDKWEKEQMDDLMFYQQVMQELEMQESKDKDNKESINE